MGFLALPGEVGEALDGDDLAALHLSGRDQARTHRHTVETDGAGTALALLTGVLGARKPHALAQHVQKGLALPDVIGFLLTAIDREVDTHYATPSVLRPLPRYVSQVQPSVRRAMIPTAWRR